MRSKTGFAILILCIISTNLKAQLLEDQFKGKAFSFSKNGDVQGNPFLFEDWKSGRVTLLNGNHFNNIMLKFDVYQNKFFFKRNDSLFEVDGNVIEIRLKDEAHLSDTTYDVVFKNNIYTNGKIPPDNFVQVLCYGKVILFKQYIKNVEGENATNGYTTTTKQMVLHTNLWATTNVETLTVKFTAHFLEQLTSDKKNQMDTYIKSQGLNIKNEKGFVSALEYYNLISKPQQ